MDDVEAVFEGGEFFITEQVGVPALQHILQRDYGGPNEDDHCWHCFESWSVCDELPQGLVGHETVEAFVARFKSVGHWREELSANFDLAL